MNARSHARLAAVAALGLAAIVAAADSFTARVATIHDGDTITVVRDRTAVKIRLDAIDCPELSQNFGARAMEKTAEILTGRVVRVEPRDVDAEGRTVARVFVDGRDVSLLLVEAGLAWHYVRYSGDETIARAENHARARRAGLWADAAPVPPWTHRQRQRALTTTATPSVGPYHGNVNSLVFHRKGCKNYDCKRCTRSFRTRDEAIRTGYTPAGDCRP